MLKNQRAKLDSYDRIDNFNTTNAQLISGIPGYTAEKTIFDAKRNSLQQALGVQESDTSGLATASEITKSTMANTVVQFALRALVIAKRSGNHTLVAALDHGISYIIRGPKQIALQRATDIRNTINNNLQLFTTITAADIATIDNAIAAYSAAEAQPVIAKQNKKASATDQIPQLIKDADEAVDNMHDLLFSYFQINNAAIVNQFKLAMQLISTGIHHTGIKALISIATPNTDRAATPLENITMKIVELNKTALTDHLGTVEIDRVIPGTYHLEFSGNGISTSTQAVTITRGHIAQANVLLQPNLN